MTKKQIDAVLAIAQLVVDAVEQAGPYGAPGGHLYAAMMSAGITLSQFESIMGTLVSAGKLRKQGHCYFVARTERGYTRPGKAVA